MLEFMGAKISLIEKLFPLLVGMQILTNPE